MGSAQGNRVKHVLEHAVPDLAKPLHSVFSVERREVLGLVDDAWRVRTGAGLLQSNGNRVWTVDMGRVVGTAGETNLQIITRDGTNRIITAYPRK
jgi:filamentous hemagglutinin